MRIILLTLLLLLSLNVQAQIVVVVDKASPIETLNESDVENIFLAKTKQFPDGSRATPIELASNEMRYKFYQVLTGKTPNQLNAYWTTLIFTGKGKPPRTVKSITTLQRRIVEQQGSISYISAEQVTDNMRIVFMLPNELTMQ